MTVTPTMLTRTAGIAAVAAGVIFIGVQIHHPHLDATTITTTDVVVRNCFKVVMGALALVGITGMYLRQVKQIGVLGLIGYLLFSATYLLIMCTSFVAAFVLPSIARTEPAFVNDVLAAANGGSAAGDIGRVQYAIQLEGISYLVGGLLFGVALYRARVLARSAAAILAVGGLVSAALNAMPEAFYRFLAFPNGIAMIALGYSLWRSVRSLDDIAPATSTARLATAGAE
jgi:hypothetical protein